MILCEVYGIEENKIVIEMDERYLKKDQKFRFEDEVFIIVSIIDTGSTPKINVVNYGHYRQLKSSPGSSPTEKGGHLAKPAVREHFDNRFTSRKDVM
jgi:hypothetical protein